MKLIVPKANHALLLTAIATLAASAAGVQQPPLALHIHSERAMFQVLISPGNVGTDSLCCN